MSFLDRLRSDDPTFKELRYDDSLALADSDGEEFEAAITANTTLQVFHLTASRRLHHLYPRNNLIIREDLVFLACRCTTLRELRICPQGPHRDLSLLNLSALCQAVANCRTLKVLHVRDAMLHHWEDCRTLRNHPSLKRISLTDVAFGDQFVRDIRTRVRGRGLDSFVESLSTLPLLEKLELELRICPENYLQRDASWALLARMKVRVLRLNNSFADTIPAVRDRSFADVFMEALEENANSKLEVLNLANNSLSSVTSEKICRAILTKPGLKVLDLKCNRNDTFKFQGISNWLRENTTLDTLNLSQNNVENEGAGALATLLSDPRSGLKKLFLDEAHIGNDGLLSISQALEHNNKLVSLSLRKNQLTDKAALAFAKVLTENRVLEYLNLYAPLEAPLNRNCGESFVSMMEDNTVMKNLNVPLSNHMHRRRIRMFALLNRKGRGRLLDHPSDKDEWIKCLSFFRHNADVVNYLIRKNPNLCSINK